MIYSRAALYIVSEKSQTRGVKAPHNSDFIPVDPFEVGKVNIMPLHTNFSCSKELFGGEK